MFPPYPFLQEWYGDHGAVLRQPEGARRSLVLRLAERLHPCVDDLDSLPLAVGLNHVAHQLKIGFDGRLQANLNLLLNEMISHLLLVLLGIFIILERRSPLESPLVLFLSVHPTSPLICSTIIFG